MITTSLRTGRLATIRVQYPITDDEFDVFLIEIRKVIVSVRSPAVFCTDLRESRLMAARMADRVMALMRRDNLHIERNAMLLPLDGAVLALQFDRILREAGSEKRRAFRDAAQAAAWLGEVLTFAEQKSLLEFIAEHGASSP